MAPDANSFDAGRDIQAVLGDGGREYVATGERTIKRGVAARELQDGWRESLRGLPIQ